VIFSRYILRRRRCDCDGLRVHRRLTVGYGMDDGLPMYGCGASDHHRAIG
jgi:hypothetical protein